MAYISPPGFHRHQCKFCTFVWEHHDANDVWHGDYGAHECPSCHRCNWSLGIYGGDEAPKVRNGKEPPPSQIAIHDYKAHPDQRGG